MCIIKERSEIYQHVALEKEILLDNLFDELKKCSIYDGSARITPNTVAILTSEEDTGDYNTMLLSKDNLPILTNKTPNELILKRRKHATYTHEVNKEIISNIYQKKVYRFPEIDKDILLVPLDGAANKSVNYINLMAVNSIRKFGKSVKDGTVIAFYDHLEIAVPHNADCLKKHFETAFEYYILISYNEGGISQRANMSNYFNHWFGDYYLYKKEAISRGIDKVTYEEYKTEKRKADIKTLSFEDFENITNAQYGG